MTGAQHPGHVPGRPRESHLRRGQDLLTAAQVRRRTQLERPERDAREVAAEVTRPDEPGGEHR